MRLLVPSLKKRTRERRTRERPIPDELAALLGELVEERRHDERFPGIPVEERPIFATRSSRIRSARGRACRQAGRRFRPETGPEDHQPPFPTYRRARRAVVPALQNGPWEPVRQRAGYPPVVIADLLDHTDLQHVGVYVETRPSIVERMDAALHGLLEPLAGLFTGTVVADEGASGVAEAPSRRVLADSGGTTSGPAVGLAAAPGSRRSPATHARRSVHGLMRRTKSCSNRCSRSARRFSPTVSPRRSSARTMRP